MSIVFLSVPRKKANYLIDERCIAAIAQLARRQNMSANRFVENLFFEMAKAEGLIPNDAEPLGETRGGDRSQSGKDN